ncbi:hypothetical protein NRP93_000415 [Clostridium botulinum]|nr:hypothetical protein [Clostridium botulinum]
MKLFSKLWWIFAIVGTIAAFLNPYIGIFGISNMVELGSLVIFNIIICCTIKKIEKYGENKVLKVYMKGLKILSYVLPVIFFLIKLFVVGTVFIVAYASKDLATPFQIWSNPDKMSIVCLIVEMIFNILLLISFICKGKIMKRMTNEYE